MSIAGRSTQRVPRYGAVAALCTALGALCIAVAGMTAAQDSAGAPVIAAAASSASPSATSSSPSPAPSASTPAGRSETLTTAVTANVSVHRGSRARVRYRADDIEGGTVTVDLLVTTLDGAVRRRLVTGRSVPVGEPRAWRGRIRLPRGRYRLVVRAFDAGGRREAHATAARLRVRAPLPPLVPTKKARRAAFAWAARRAGRVSVAVVDSRGRVYGYRKDRRFVTASVVKAMLLVAYLRRHESLNDARRATLRRMITVSDNAAADAVYRDVGRRRLVRLARQAKMRTFEASASWIVCRCGAADMALFFRHMERYIPRRHRRFARRVLSQVVPYQSWGIPAAARPRGYRVYFKPGWLGAWTLANQAGRLERRRVRLGIAVFTDRNPSPSYGKETVAGVTARLLRR